MKGDIYIYIIVLLIFTTIYFYNKSIVVEKLTNIDSSEILQKLSSIYNDDTLTVKKLNVTGEITTPKITSKSINGDTLRVPSITTRHLYSTDGNDSWINIHPNCHMYKTAYSDGKFSTNTELSTKKITCNTLSSISITTSGDITCNGTLRVPKNFSFQNYNIKRENRTLSDIPILTW